MLSLTDVVRGRSIVIRAFDPAPFAALPDEKTEPRGSNIEPVVLIEAETRSLPLLNSRAGVTLIDVARRREVDAEEQPPSYTMDGERRGVAALLSADRLGLAAA